MATTTGAGRRPEGQVPSSSHSFETRRARPVLWWAALGGFFGFIALFSWISWFTSSDLTRTSTGPTPVPGYMAWGAHIQEVVGILVFPVLVYWFIVRPWRRDGHISLDGTILIVALGLYWCDPLANYFGTTVSYNSVFVNWGSWSSHIPGWASANGSRMPEPVFYAGLWYSYGTLGVIFLINYIMRRAKRRWPRLGTAGLLLVAFVSGIVIDFVMEYAYLRLGSYSYPGVYKPLTLNYGHYYQFPLLVPLFTGFGMAGWACVRYFRNDKGETVVERGLDDVRVAPRQRYLLRGLALYGIFNLIAVGANVQYWWTSQHEAPWPKDIIERSYFTNGICNAPASDVACPGGVVSVTQRGTAHLGPNNTLVVPKGKHLPTPTPSATK